MVLPASLLLLTLLVSWFVADVGLLTLPPVAVAFVWGD